MNMSDRADVYNGLLDGMMWAEAVLEYLEPLEVSA